MLTLEGVVTAGRRLGRRLGFPTANVELAEPVALSDGVYLSEVECEGKTWWAVTNLGTNPTVGGCRRRLESHLLDYSGPVLYDKPMRIRLLKRLRSEHHFESLQELQHQIEADIREARDEIVRLKTENDKL